MLLGILYHLRLFVFGCFGKFLSHKAVGQFWQFAFETDRKEQGLAPYVTRPLKVKEDLKANRSPLRMEEWRNGYWVFVQMFFRMFVNYSLFGIIFHCCTGEQCVVFARYFIASEYNCDAGATQALRRHKKWLIRLSLD